MKKILTVILTLLICFSGKTQHNQKEAIFTSIKSLSIGFKVGINLTTITVDLGPEEKLMPKFQGTLALRKRYSKVYSIQPELQYSRQGYYLASTGPTGYKDNFITEYLNFTPFSRFDFGKSKTNFFILLGPYIGMMVNGKEKVSFTYFNGDTENHTNYLTDYSIYNRFDLGVSFGVGISQTLKSGDQIVFDSHLNGGFITVLKKEFNTNMFNLYNSFSIGYLYKFR